MKPRENFWVPWFVCWGIALAFFLIINTMAYFLCDSPECNHNFYMVKLIGQLFVVITSIVYIVLHFVDYFTLNELDDHSVKMSFNNFRDAYYVNSDRWHNFDGSLVYKYYGKKYISYHVVFSYFDWLRFLHWQKINERNRRRKLKMAMEEEHNVRMAEMLKCIQADINEAYEKIKDMTAE